MTRITPSREQFLRECGDAEVVPVTRDILADQHTPVSLLQRFYHPNNTNGVFLFESAQGGEKWGRYSFLGIDTHAFVEVHAECVLIIEGETTRKIPHHGKPLDVLRELMRGYRSVERPHLPRFFGGLVGYFTYEMVSFFEKIPHRLDGEPFASFVIPKTVLIFDNVQQRLTVCVLAFPHPEQTESMRRQLYDDTVQQIDAIVAKLEQPQPTPQPTLSHDVTLSPLLTEREYRQRVAAVKEHIARGDIIQCVLSQPFVSENAPDAVSLYRALRFANPAPYLFFMHLGETVLVGSSPETMVRLEGRTATLRPIAGTRRRGNSEQHDREMADELLRDPKEKAEHLMLVDLGRNDLGRIAKTGTVQVTELMMIERYSHVMHLVSNVTAELDAGLDGFDLFEVTFPAGTLSGAPKVRAMQIIAENESTPRSVYGGAVGYISFSGNIDFAITIRTARLRKNKLTVQAGGGIVYDSNSEAERQETVNKAMGIAKALDMLSGDIK
ncbi:MAG: anthranilate synthase component I family protein [Thermoguttaceae bacterium]